MDASKITIPLPCSWHSRLTGDILECTRYDVNNDKMICQWRTITKHGSALLYSNDFSPFSSQDRIDLGLDGNFAKFMNENLIKAREEFIRIERQESPIRKFIHNVIGNILSFFGK